MNLFIVDTIFKFLCIHLMYTVFIMSAVISIRVSKELKEKMKGIPIDWRREIERFIEQKIREYMKKKYLEIARRCREKMKMLPISGAELIREDRDAR